MRLLTPSAGSGEGALSLEDIVGEEPSTSFPVQTNHCPALFCGSVIRDKLSRHAVDETELLPSVVKRRNNEKFGKSRL